MWSDVLNASERTALYRGCDFLQIRAANLEACYRGFGVGTSELDLTGNGYDLTMNGDAGTPTYADSEPSAMFGQYMWGRSSEAATGNRRRRLLIGT